MRLDGRGGRGPGSRASCTTRSGPRRICASVSMVKSSRVKPPAMRGLGLMGLMAVSSGGRERVERLARRVGRVGQHQPHEPLSVRGVGVMVSAVVSVVSVSVSAVSVSSVSAVSAVLWGAVGSCWSRRGPTWASEALW